MTADKARDDSSSTTMGGHRGNICGQLVFLTSFFRIFAERNKQTHAHSNGLVASDQ